MSANLQPHLVNLITGLRRHQVEEAVALLLDYIDAGRAQACRSSEKVQVVQEHQSARAEAAQAPIVQHVPADDTEGGAL